MSNLPRSLRPMRLLAALVIGVLAFVTSACSVRLETAPPTEPTPDVAETLRAAMVQDVVTIRDQAHALSLTEGLDAPTTAALSELEAASDQQYTELGGVYDSGLTSQSETVSSPPPSPAAATGAGLTTTLIQAAARAVAALPSVPDAADARLYAAIAVSHRAWAQRLASVVQATLPEGSDALAPVDATTLPTLAPMDSERWRTLVVAQDAEGYIHELRAARMSSTDQGGAEDPRTVATQRASEARATARAWAEATELAPGADDPRQTVYTIPGGIPADDAGLLAQVGALEWSQVEVMVGAVNEVEADARSTVAALASQLAVSAVADGAPIPSATPGLVASATPSPSGSPTTSPSA